MKRVVIVGASSGLGRCMAAGLVSRGDRVALLARRTAMVEAAAAEIGEGATAVRCDVTDPDSVAEAIETSANTLGAIDAVVYAAAVGTLARIEDTSASMWRQAMDTNVIGASLITAAALPHLRASRGTALYLSTVGASFTPPWAGLAAYQVSKAAMERLVDCWRNEHPEVAFTRMTIGECPGGEGDYMTQFSAGFDRELMGELAGSWIQQRLFSGALIDVEHLIQAVHGVLHAGPSLSIPHLVVAAQPTA